VYFFLFSIYSKISLLLCSECRIALFSDTFSSHVKSHYKQHAENEKQRELLSQISSLSLFTAAETFALIQQLSMTLSAFSELDVHKNAFSCNLCHLVLLNKEKMKRHCSKNHASDFKHTVTSSVTAQSLHKRRFFFQVQARSLSTTSYSRPSSLRWRSQPLPAAIRLARRSVIPPPVNPSPHPNAP